MSLLEILLWIPTLLGVGFMTWMAFYWVIWPKGSCERERVWFHRAIWIGVAVAVYVNTLLIIKVSFY